MRVIRSDEYDVFFESLYEAVIASLKKKEGGPFAAGVVLEGSLVAVGTNGVLTSNDVSRHAEVNALAEAGRIQNTFNLSGSLLLTTHFPCLMCYHAVKWAQIDKVYYLFDYQETESVFGFHGDNALLRDLGLDTEAFRNDPSLELVRYRSLKTDTLFRNELVRRWNEEFRYECSGYDLC